MVRAHSAYTVDLSQQNTESKVLPATPYNPAALEISGSFGSVQIVASDEQLAEIESAIKEHFNRNQYPLPAESKEEIA